MAINSFRLAVVISEIEKQQADMALRWVMLKMWLEKEEAAQQSFAPDPETGGAKSDDESTPAVSGR